MEEMYFNDGWMDTDLAHHVLSVTITICEEHCQGDARHIENTTEFLAHFMSCWYQAILDGNGALVQPAVKSVAWFVQHMIEEHEMDPENSVGCAGLLVRFTSFVITKAGGRLI